MSNTGQASAQSFRWGKVERPEGMVHIPGIEGRIGGGNCVRLAPQRFALDQPGSIALRQILRFWSIAPHGTAMMPHLVPGRGEHRRVAAGGPLVERHLA